METWNVVEMDEGYVLLNSTATLIRLAKHVRMNVAELLDKMEELQIPLKYTSGLKEIYMTQLYRYGKHGDYLENHMRLSCGPNDKEYLPKTFVHELAHHVDDREGIRLDEAVISEYKKHWRSLGDKYARKNVGEYVAIGFEIFYCGTKGEKSRLRKKNPRLYKAIRKTHLEYLSK